MADFDNLFDEAMARADTTIRGVMGAEARITSGSLSGVTLRGVFDDPENIGFAEAGIRIDGTRPTFFVNSSDVSGMIAVPVMYGWVVDYLPADRGVVKEHSCR